MRTRSQSRALAQVTRHANGLDSAETSHPTAAELQVTLPADVLYLIVAECDRDTLAKLRLTCKLLAAEAAKYLFKHVYVDFYDDTMQRLIELMKWPIPAKSVKSLDIHDCPLLPKLSFYRFRKYVELEDESHRADTAFMRGMYNDYKNDEQARSVHERVCFMHDDFDTYGPIYPQFEQAIGNLSNLREVRIFGLGDEDDKLIWRGMHFAPKLEQEFDLRADEAVAAAAMAFALRSIGLRNIGLRCRSGHPLTCLSLEFPVSWWGPRDVQKVWESLAKYQVLDGVYDYGPIHYDDDSVDEAIWTRQQMGRTRMAFAHLKTLRLDINVGYATFGNDCKALGEWFDSARGLQCLHLEIVCDYDGRFDMVAGIVEHCQLPALQDLKLEVETSVDSLIALLSRVSDTLRSLRLFWCFIVAEDGGSWPDFYERMHDIPFKQLRHLDFARCVDFDDDVPDMAVHDAMIYAVQDYVDGICDSPPTEIVLHGSLTPRDVMHKACSSYELYGYLLKKRPVMPPLFLYYTENDDTSSEGP